MNVRFDTTKFCDVHRALVLLVLTLATGCAKLDVQVAILDDSYKSTTRWRSADIWRSEERVRTLVTATDEGGQDPLSAAEKKTLTSVNDAFNKIYAAGQALDVYLAKHQAPDSKYESSLRDALQSTQDTVREDVKRRYTSARRAYECGLAVARNARVASPESRYTVLANADQQFQLGDDTLRTLPLWLRDKLAPVEANQFLLGVVSTANALHSDVKANGGVSAEAKVEAAAHEAATAPAKAVVELKVQVQGIVGTNGLFDDRDASRVINAPDEYWNGIFNRSYGAGQFGNTDIAVKMQSEADFTVKGIRVDASKVTQATFAAIGQSVKIVAAMYGVPTGGTFPTFGGDGKAKGDVSAKDAGAAGAAGAASTASNSSAEEQTRQIESLQRRRRAAALRIIAALAHENTSIDPVAPGGAAGPVAPTAEQLNDVASRAKTALESNRSELSLPAPAFLSSATDKPPEEKAKKPEAPTEVPPATPVSDKPASPDTPAPVTTQPSGS